MSIPLRIRSHLHGYHRDSYLGTSTPLNPEFPEIDCAVGYSQWGVSPRAVKAHRDFDPESVSAYPELFYDRLLKPVIMERFGLRGVDPGQIFFGHGSFNLAERLIHKLIHPGILLGVGPQFNEIPSEFVAAGGGYHPIPITQDGQVSLQEMIAQLRTGLFSALYLDNPNNPLGSMLSLAEVESLCDIAESFGTIVIVDEAYGDFVDDEFSAARLVSDFSNLAVIRSFSKGLGLAAARVGYMFLSKELAHTYRELDVPFEPGLHGAVMAKATLEDREFISRLRFVVSTDKSMITRALREAGFIVLPTHQGVSILSVFHPDCLVVDTFASIGVSVEAGSCFAQTNTAWDNHYARLRVPKTELVNELCQRIARLASV